MSGPDLFLPMTHQVRVGGRAVNWNMTAFVVHIADGKVTPLLTSNLHYAEKAIFSFKKPLFQGIQGSRGPLWQDNVGSFPLPFYF